MHYFFSGAFELVVFCVLGLFGFVWWLCWLWQAAETLCAETRKCDLCALVECALAVIFLLYPLSGREACVLGSVRCSDWETDSSLVFFCPKKS